MDNSFKVNRGINLLPQTTTPTNPSNGDLYYDSTLSKFRKYENGLWSDLGSGSGSGKNYLGTVNGINGNGDLELGTTSKWSLFNTTITSLIPTGTITAGAASITTFDTVSSAQLAGSFSLRTAASSAWAAGQGFISDAFTIEEEDRSQPLSFKGYFKVFSGSTNGVFSGLSTNTFHVYVYDVTNSKWVQPTGVFSIASNVKGYLAGSVQLDSNCTQARLAIVAASASTGAISMYWDDFSFGPNPTGLSIPSPVLPMTVTRILSGSGTYTTPGGVKYLEIEMCAGGGGGAGSDSTGGTGATGGNSTFGSSLLTCVGGSGASGGNALSQSGAGGTPTVSAPAIALVSLTGGRGSAPDVIGSNLIGAMGGGNPFGGQNGQPANVATGLQGTDGTGAGGAGGSAQGAATGGARNPGAGGGAGAYIKALINNPSASYSYAVGAGGAGGTQGAGGNSQAGGKGGDGIIIIREYYVSMSADSGRRVSCAVNTSPTTVPNGTDQQVVFSVVESDNTGSYSTSTGLFTAPVPGDYIVTGFLEFGTFAWSTGQTVRVGVVRNGVLQRFIYDSVFTAAASNTGGGGGSFILTNMKAGETIGLTGFQNTGSSRAYNSDGNRQHMCIALLPSSSTASTSTDVSAKYTCSSQTFPNTVAFTTVNYDTKVYDTHSAVTTGASWVFTAPFPGKYRISGGIFLTASAYTAGNTSQMQFIKAGNSPETQYVDCRPTEANGTYEKYLQASATYTMVAGDTLKAAILNNRSGGSTGVNAGLSYICIEKVG